MESEMIENPIEDLWTEHDVAKFLGLSVRTIQQWRYRGDGPRYLKINDAVVRYRPGVVSEWAEEYVQSNTAA